MQWLVVRLLLEVSFCGPVVEAFGGCHNVEDMLSSFESFDELKKRGVVVGIVFAGAAVAETFKAVIQGVMSIRMLLKSRKNVEEPKTANKHKRTRKAA